MAETTVPPNHDFAQVAHRDSLLAQVERNQAEIAKICEGMVATIEERRTTAASLAAKLDHLADMLGDMYEGDGLGHVFKGASACRIPGQ